VVVRPVMAYSAGGHIATCVQAKVTFPDLDSRCTWFQWFYCNRAAADVGLFIRPYKLNKLAGMEQRVTASSSHTTHGMPWLRLWGTGQTSCIHGSKVHFIEHV
jgi:hypothetical protein